MTRKGTLIWNILKEAQVSRRHLTAEEVYQQAKKRDAGIAMATVYNNLNALEAQGRIRRVRQSSGPDRFDGNVIYHDHMVCERCGKMTDVTLRDFSKELQKRVGIDITGYELNIRYICPECRKEPNGA